MSNEESRKKEKDNGQEVAKGKSGPEKKIKRKANGRDTVPWPVNIT